VAPAVTLLSLLFTHHLGLAFRWSELVAMAGAAALVAFLVRDGCSTSRDGALLVGAYAAAVVGFYLVGGQ
jgi:Ca2+/H+ antiporter